MDVDDTPAQAPTAGPGPDASDQGGSTRWIVELLGVVVIAVLIAILLRAFVVATYSIPSGSMEPTLQIGDRIVVDELTTACTASTGRTSSCSRRLRMRTAPGRRCRTSSSA